MMEEHVNTHNASNAVAHSNGKRRGDGGVYLVIYDRRPEFARALRYACRVAMNRRGRVAVLAVVEDPGFQDWSAVEHKLRAEQRLKAEEGLLQIGQEVLDLTQKLPAFYVYEGDIINSVLQILDTDTQLAGLVLSGATEGSDPGPLVHYFAGKGLAKLSVPLMIVPSHLDLLKIDTIG